MTAISKVESSPDISIIILSWNVRELLRACLRSLPAPATGVEVIVVDAGSADGSAAMLASEFPWVQLIASSENLGYSRGNNMGLARARGRSLLVLNPDTELIGDALAAMVAHMDCSPRIGVVGPQLVGADGRPQSSRRRFPTLATAFFESTWLQPIAPRALLNRFYAADLPPDVPARVDWLTGAALLLRAEAYQQVGGFDESFFMYSEELDWQKRAAAAGWEVHHVPAARVIHHEAQSSAQVPAATHIRFNTSKVRYHHKHNGRVAGQLLRVWLLAGFGLQLGLEWLKGLLGHRRGLRRARVAAYRQVLRSGLKL